MASNIAEVILRIKQQGITDLEQVIDALEEVEKKSKKAKSATDDLGDASGHLGQSSQKLAGSLSMVAPEVGGAAMAIADLADIGEVAAATSAALGVSLSTLAVAALPIAAIVAAVAVAWRAHTEAAKASEEAMKAAAVAADTTRKAIASLTDIIFENTVKQKELRGEITASQAEQMRAGRSLATTYLPDLERQASALELAKIRLRELTAAQTTQQDLAEEGLRNTLPAASAAVAAQTDEVARLRAAYAELEQTYQKARGTQQETIILEGAAKDATKANTAAIKEQFDAEAAFLTGVDAEIAKLGQWGNTAADEVDRVFDGFAKYTAQWEEAGAAREAAMLSDMEMTAAWAEAQAAAQQVAASRISNAANTAAGVGGAVVGGSVSGLVSTLGPAIGAAVGGPVGAAVGEALGQAVSFLEALGQTSIAEIKANMLSSAANIRAGLEMLPSLLSELMPDLIQAIASGFIQALPELIALQYKLLAEMTLFPLRILQGFVQGMGEWWASIGGLQGLGQSVVEALGRWWREAWAAIRDFLRHPLDRDQDGRRLGGEAIDASKRAMSFLWSGEFATGTDYVPRTGLALVHQGERIETARGGGMGARTSAGGGDVHLHLSGFAIGTADQLIRELNKHLGAGNRRLSWSG